MNYITEFEKRNITFSSINADDVLQILKNEFSYYKLLDLAVVFEKYRDNDRSNQYVSLDFSQLYYLAQMDFKINQILMNICLDIERRLKTRFLYDTEATCDADKFILEYFETDKEYIQQVYLSDNIDIIKNKYSQLESIFTMNFHDFVEITQFGTLIRLLHFFYTEKALEMYISYFEPFERYLESVKRLRNSSAHNHSFISRLAEKTEYKDYKMLSFLGKNGIANKTLKTNMSRTAICDLCGLVYTYTNVGGNPSILKDYLYTFENEFVCKYGYLFNKNDTLCSSYNFIQGILDVFT